MIALFLVLQSALPSVGDTIWLRRAVAAPAGWTVRAPNWDLTGTVERLGRPHVIRRGDSAEVAWPVTAWAPGEHVVSVPGPVLVQPNGMEDSLPAQPTTIVLRSVLPRVPPDSTLKPQPPAPVVPTMERSIVPLLVLLAVAAVLLLPLHWWWRRRGPAMAVPVLPVPSVDPPVARWADAGEGRVVLDAAVERLRIAIDGRRSDASLGEAKLLLSALEAARFADEPVADAAELYARTTALESRLAT
ncbi:MAG TPA: hypothetical protein VHJ69_11000 [Gemmatimonadales bacterium]|nr:hypothetical protein [Gemmatimonadales bacterium]